VRIPFGHGLPQVIIFLLSSTEQVYLHIADTVLYLLAAIFIVSNGVLLKASSMSKECSLVNILVRVVTL
jgi:hypothetical protein